jgi:hypothetical protein
VLHCGLVRQRKGGPRVCVCVCACVNRVRLASVWLLVKERGLYSN